MALWRRKGHETVNDAKWWKLLRDPLPGRVPKPRIAGLTMVIDTGLPLCVFHDLLQLANPHVDFWKFGFGSAGVCAPEVVESKVSLCQEYGVFAYPGGTSLEIAIAQNVWREYLVSLWAGGIRVVEVSDGTIELALNVRRQVIETAKQMGFKVLTEVGKKRAGTLLPIAEQAKLIRCDLNAGAQYVIIEGRESGRDVGFFEENGRVRIPEVQQLVEEVGPYATRLIWEAPLREQQVFYIRQFGNRVNLGNIHPLDLIPLESLRCGLRSDTFAASLPDNETSDASNQEKLSRMSGDESNVDSDCDSLPTLWSPDKKRGPSNPRDSKSSKRDG